MFSFNGRNESGMRVYKRDNNFLMSFTRQFFQEAETINLRGFVALC